MFSSHHAVDTWIPMVGKDTAALGGSSPFPMGEPADGPSSMPGMVPTNGGMHEPHSDLDISGDGFDGGPVGSRAQPSSTEQPRLLGGAEAGRQQLLTGEEGPVGDPGVQQRGDGSLGRGADGLRQEQFQQREVAQHQQQQQQFQTFLQQPRHQQPLRMSTQAQYQQQQQQQHRQPAQAARPIAGDGNRRRLARGPRSDGSTVDLEPMYTEDHRVLKVERSEDGKEAYVWVTLLAAGFVIGSSGAAARQIGHVTGAGLQSWTEAASGIEGVEGEEIRRFRIQGKKEKVERVIKLIHDAVDKYKELCDRKREGQFVLREHRIDGVDFQYQPPPRKALQNKGPGGPGQAPPGGALVGGRPGVGAGSSHSNRHQYQQPHYAGGEMARDPRRRSPRPQPRQEASSPSLAGTGRGGSFGGSMVSGGAAGDILAMGVGRPGRAERSSSVNSLPEEALGRGRHPSWSDREPPEVLDEMGLRADKAPVKTGHSSFSSLQALHQQQPQQLQSMQLYSMQVARGTAGVQGNVDLTHPVADITSRLSEADLLDAYGGSNRIVGSAVVGGSPTPPAHVLHRVASLHEDVERAPNGEHLRMPLTQLQQQLDLPWAGPLSSLADQGPIGAAPAASRQSPMPGEVRTALGTNEGSFRQHSDQQQGLHAVGAPSLGSLYQDTNALGSRPGSGGEDLPDRWRQKVPTALQQQQQQPWASNGGRQVHGMAGLDWSSMDRWFESEENSVGSTVLSGGGSSSRGGGSSGHSSPNALHVGPGPLAGPGANGTSNGSGGLAAASSRDFPSLPSQGNHHGSSSGGAPSGYSQQSFAGALLSGGPTAVSKGAQRVSPDQPFDLHSSAFPSLPGSNVGSIGSNRGDIGDGRRTSSATGPSSIAGSAWGSGGIGPVGTRGHMSPSTVLLPSTASLDSSSSNRSSSSSSLYSHESWDLPPNVLKQQQQQQQQMEQQQQQQRQNNAQQPAADGAHHGKASAPANGVGSAANAALPPGMLAAWGRPSGVGGGPAALGAYRLATQPGTSQPGQQFVWVQAPAVSAIGVPVVQMVGGLHGAIPVQWPLAQQQQVLVPGSRLSAAAPPFALGQQQQAQRHRGQQQSETMDRPQQQQQQQQHQQQQQQHQQQQPSPFQLGTLFMPLTASDGSGFGPAGGAAAGAFQARPGPGYQQDKAPEKLQHANGTVARGPSALEGSQVCMSCAVRPVLFRTYACDHEAVCHVCSKCLQACPVCGATRPQPAPPSAAAASLATPPKSGPLPGPSAASPPSPSRATPPRGVSPALIVCDPSLLPQPWMAATVYSRTPSPAANLPNSLGGSPSEHLQQQLGQPEAEHLQQQQ